MAAEPVEDVRSTRPYILSPTPLKTLGRRLASVVALASIDIAGLVIGLYAALALRSAIFDPKPILWGLLWDHETDWLAFLILLLDPRLLAGGPVQAARDARGGGACRAERVPRRGAVARVRDRHRPALHDVRPLRRRRALRRRPDRRFPRQLRDRHRHRCCGLPACAARRCSSATRRSARTCARRSARAAAASTTSSSARPTSATRFERDARHASPLDEMIVADAGLDEPRLLEIVEAAHRRGVQGARRAADDRAADRARRVRAGPGRAAVRAAPADLRRRRVGDQAHVRPRRRHADRRRRAARLAAARGWRSSCRRPARSSTRDRADRARRAAVRDAQVPHDGRRRRRASRARSRARTRRRARCSRSATTRA